MENFNPSPIVPPQGPIQVNSSKFSKPVITYLVIIGIFVVGYFVLAKYQSWWPFGSLTQQTTPSPTTSNITANWKTYQNTKNNYELKYPDTWEIDAGPGVDQDGPDLPEISLFNSSSATDRSIRIEANPYPHEVDKIYTCSGLADCAQKYDSFFQVSEGDTIVGKQNIKFAGTDAIQERINRQQGSWVHLRTFIFHNNSFFVINFTTKATDFDSGKIEYDQIISTFRFTNSSPALQNDWKTYRNTSYIYSFRYPVNFTIYTGTNQAKEEVIPPTATSDKVFLTDNKAFLFCCEALVTSVSIIPDSVDIKDWRKYVEVPDYQIKSQKEIIFAGRKALEVRFSVGIESPGARVILIPSDPWSWLLTQGDEGEPRESITNSFSIE